MSTTRFLERHGGEYLDGIRMRWIDGDYDWVHLKSVKYKYSKEMHERMRKIKEDNEHGYTCSDFDCNGSSCVRIKIRRKGRHIFMSYYKSIDV